MPKILIGVSILLMSLALLFGLLNTNKVKDLRNELAAITSARQITERARITTEKKLQERTPDFAGGTSKVTAAEARANSAEAELRKTQKDNAELASKLQASTREIAEVQKNVTEASSGARPSTAEDSSPNELKTLLADTRHQLEAAEQEKSLLADKVRAAQDRVAAIEQEKKRRPARANPPGVHGTVLAVNQAYNFIVLSIGDRQGVVPNSEMLVLRGGAFIGKIRISSVEPTTSIGDIITKSLARGVQVQPGDTVVYAGNTDS